MKNLLPLPLMMLLVICAAAVFCNMASAGLSTMQADKEGVMKDAFEEWADGEDIDVKKWEDVTDAMDWTHGNALAKEKRDWIETFPFQDIAFYRAAMDIINVQVWKRPLTAPKFKRLFNLFRSSERIQKDNKRDAILAEQSRKSAKEALEALQLTVHEGLQQERITAVQLNRLYVRACRTGWSAAHNLLRTMSGVNLSGQALAVCENWSSYHECIGPLYPHHFRHHSDPIGNRLCLDFETEYADDLIQFLTSNRAWRSTVHVLKAMVLNPYYYVDATPLRALAYNDTYAKLYLAKGADPNVGSGTNLNTALHTAAKWDYLATTSLLIQYGARVNVRNKNRQTPLHLAGSTPTIELLLNAGANAMAIDIYGRTPLHYIANKYIGIVAISLLLKKGGSLIAKDNDGNTPVHIAALNGSKELLALMLHETGGIQALKERNRAGKTPLQVATGKAKKIIKDRQNVVFLQ
jgi:hypothetical protein